MGVRLMRRSGLVRALLLAASSAGCGSDPAAPSGPPSYTSLRQIRRECARK